MDDTTLVAVLNIILFLAKAVACVYWLSRFRAERECLLDFNVVEIISTVFLLVVCGWIVVPVIFLVLVLTTFWPVYPDRMPADLERVMNERMEGWQRLSRHQTGER